MRVGIVTFYRVPNYGAMLQAYVLWKYLAARGHQVEFVNYPYPTTRPQPFPWKIITRRFKFKRDELKRHYDLFMTEFARVYPQSPFVTSAQELNDVGRRYDVAIVGSDQMWNPNWTDAERYPLVFLQFVPEGVKKLSYAVSLGVRDWGKDDSDEVGRLMRGFDGLSVREQSGSELVCRLSGKTAEVLLDPTLLQTRDFYESLFTSSRGKTHPYVFKYLLTEFTDCEKENASIAKICSQLGVPRVEDDLCLPKSVLGIVSCWCLGVRTRASVLSWLQRISSSAFVATNSFHGTVFSLIFHRPFVTFPIEGRLSGMNERVTSLLQAVGLADRLVSSDDYVKIEHLVTVAIDWDEVDARLVELRKRTDLFFESHGL